MNCLSSDRVQSHYLCGSSNKLKDSQRLHSLSISKFEQALRQFGDDPNMLISYSQSLCKYLRADSPDEFNIGVEEGKVKIMEIFDKFCNHRNGDGIASIIHEIPKETVYSELICYGFKKLREVNTSFFSISHTLSRKDIVYYPYQYCLIEGSNPWHYLDTAAYIFKEVVKDTVTNLIL